MCMNFLIISISLPQSQRLAAITNPLIDMRLELHCFAIKRFGRSNRSRALKKRNPRSGAAKKECLVAVAKGLSYKNVGRKLFTETVPSPLSYI
jgi:hypothetical protein